MKRLSPDIIFESGPLTNNLARKSVHGGMIIMTSQGAQFFLRILGTMILARLLTPGDYGVIGMTTVIISFAALFKDAGLFLATVQKSRISHDQISNLFWFNVFISVILGLGVMAISPLAAIFYDRPEMAPVTAAMSISLIFGGLTTQHEALVRRHLRFDIQAAVQLLSQALSLIVTISLALLGWHYWALVAGSIATAVSRTLLIIYYCPWMPGTVKKGTGIRTMLKFGSHLVGSNFVNYFSKNTDRILVGKFIGADALGLYSKANAISQMPLTQVRGPVTQLAIPMLSSLQDQPERYVKYFQRIVEILTSLMIPISLYCAIEADFLIRIVLGQQWIAIVPVFRILVCAAVLKSVSGTADLVLLSRGHSDRYFFWGIVSTCISVASFAVGIPFGVKGVAAAYTVANLILFFPTLIYCFRKSPITLSLFLNTITLPLLISLLAAGIAILVKIATEKHQIVEHLSVLGVFAGVLISSFYYRQPLRETLTLMLQGVPVFFTKKSTGTPA